MNRRLAVGLLILGGWLIGGTLSASGQGHEPPTEEDIIAHGEYLAEIAGCIGCHTPYTANYNTRETLTGEDIQTLALHSHDALDTSRLMSGGRLFDLGPGGTIITPNLTPHETGLGNWTDEEIKEAIRRGRSPEGRALHPIMPYRHYSRMAESDLDALIAYLRNLTPLENVVPDPEIAIPQGEMVIPAPPRTPPNAENVAARGTYLMNAVLSCQLCHTPLNQETGSPVVEQGLAGGQPYEGPWGIVYASNITPHERTGIGGWSDAELKRAITEGVNPDGRRLVLMPWQDYANLSEADLNAVVTYLRDEAIPVEHDVPPPALSEGFQQFRPVSRDESTREEDDNLYLWVLGGLLALWVATVIWAVRLWQR